MSDPTLKFASLSETDDGTFDIIGVEVFAEGTWKGRKFTGKDLKEMEDNFTDLSAEVIPGMKLGHVQSIEGGVSAPRFGTVTRLYRKGKVLLADFTGVAKAVATVIEKGGYPRVSIELWRKFKASSGKVFKNVIDAVAFLGSEQPEVSTLADVVGLFENDIEADLILFDSEDRDVEEVEVEPEVEEEEAGEEAEESREGPNPEPEDDDMSDEAKEELSRIEGERDEFERKANTEKERADKAEADLSEIRLEKAAESAKAEAATFFDSMAEKMIPAERELAEPILCAALAAEDSETPMKFEKDGEGVKVSDSLKALFELRTELADGVYGQIFSIEDPEKRGETASTLLDEKADAYSKEHSVSYSIALKAVREANPELAQDADGEHTLQTVEEAE